MKKLLILSVYIFVAFCVSACSTEPNAGPDKEEIEDIFSKVQGNSIQIDPSALYTTGITPEALVADLKKAKINSVHFMVVQYWDGSRNDNLLKPEYLKALKNNGIAMWLMMLGNCFYDKTDLPKEWEMKTLSPYPGVSFYTFHHPDFIKWQADRVKRFIKDYPEFIGVEYAESYFPEWKTLQTNGFYGDVSQYALDKFSKEFLKADKVYGFDEIRSTVKLYRSWVDFRAEAVLNFNKKIKEAIKEANPNFLFAAWGMGVQNGTLEDIRESFGLDMVKIVQEVKPDIFFVQTAAQDWGDSNLKPDYISKYQYVVNALKQADPNIRLGLQADIASLSYHDPNVPKRNGTWWKSFMENSLKQEYFTNTAYEYSFYKKQGLWID